MISILLTLAAQDPAPAPGETPPPVVEAPAAEGASPLPLITVRPIETNSDAGLAVGHTGSVFVEVDVQPDGTKGEVALVESSRSEILDAEAVALVSGATLRGQAEPTRYRIEVKFEPYNFLEMTCRDFALQARWFERTWPEKDVKDTTLYTASVGLVTIMSMNEGGSNSMAMLRGVREMPAKWPRVVSECERQPNRRYGQVLLQVMR